MQGVVSLLDSVYNAEVENLWRELASDCGLAGIELTPIPHFSWQVAQDYDLPALRRALQEISSSAVPFTARTTGIGMFTGAHPVLYIALVKDENLLHFHEMVWQKMNGTAQAPSPYYMPDAWMPHITLARSDTNWMRLNCAMEKLVFQSFNWEFLVDNIALISQAEGHGDEQTLFYRFGQA